MKHKILLSIYLCGSVLVFTNCIKATLETQGILPKIKSKTAEASFDHTFSIESLKEPIKSTILIISNNLFI